MVTKIFKKAYVLRRGGGPHTWPQKPLSCSRTGVLQAGEHNQGGVRDAGEIHNTVDLGARAGKDR